MRQRGRHGADGHTRQRERERKRGDVKKARLEGQRPMQTEKESFACGLLHLPTRKSITPLAHFLGNFSRKGSVHPPEETRIQNALCRRGPKQDISRTERPITIIRSEDDKQVSRRWMDSQTF